jgi:hypothetical protein
MDSTASATTSTSSATVSDAERTVDIDSTEETTVRTSQPKITGKAAPQTTIDITVNSETQITQQLVTDAEGNFELDIAELSENLEPGEHSVQIAYTDPNTGEQVTKTKTFYVEADESTSSLSSTDNTSSQRLAQATTQQNTGSGGPYSSDNPYTGTQSATTSSPSPTATQSATSSSRVSMPSTESAVPVSGSVGMTMLLSLGGTFFILAAGWSYWLAQQVEAAHVQVQQRQDKSTQSYE